MAGSEGIWRLLRRLLGRRRSVWVLTFERNATGLSGIYRGVDQAAVRGAPGLVKATKAAVFWGGLHHNVNEVRAACSQNAFSSFLDQIARHSILFTHNGVRDSLHFVISS